MQMRMINSMMQKRPTRKWFRYDFIITIIAVRFGTIFIVIVIIIAC